MRRRPNRRDVLFLVDTVMPGSADRERLAERLMVDATRLGLWGSDLKICVNTF